MTDVLDLQTTYQAILEAARDGRFISYGDLAEWCIDQAGIDDAVLKQIQHLMAELNDEIAADRSLGAQFRIGHSYVTPAPGETVPDGKAWFRAIVETEIAPLLEEYWFDNLDKAASSKARLLQGL